MSRFLSRKKGQPAGKSLLSLSHAIVLAVLLLLSLVAAGVSWAEEMPEEQPAQTEEPSPTPESGPPLESAPAPEFVPALEFLPADESAPDVTPPLSDEPPEEPFFEPLERKFEETADRTHEIVQRNLLERIIRLDNFYGTARAETRRQTGYHFRLRNALRAGTDGKFEYGPSIRANIVLPKISEKLRLTIAGDDEPVQVTPSLPEDPGNPGFDRTAGNNARLVNTEFRYGLIDAPSMNLFLGAGFRFVLPPQVFARARFSYTYHLSDVSLFRLQETLFIRNPEGPGQTTEIALERLLDPKTLLRWASSGTAAYGIRGIEWGSELSRIHELSSKSAITLMGGIYGNSSVNDTITNYRLLTLYRRNFLRSWLFYELEPELFWRRKGDGDFPTNFAFTVRLEVVFEGTAEKK